VVKQHWKRWLAVGVLLGGAQVAVQLSGVGPAQAFYPAPVRYMARTVTDSTPSKTIDVVCPGGLRVYGGGGEVNDGGARKVMLTELRPAFASEDFFEVTAQEPAAGFDGNWSLTGYAICGYGGNLLIVSNSNSPASIQYSSLKAACPYGYHGVGAGAAVGGADGRVGLQLVRPSDALRDSWASGRADTTTNLPDWYLTGYLVCAVNYPIGSRYVGQVANTYAASVGCPSGTFAFGAGAGGNTHDSGLSYLQSIVPTPDLDGVISTMTSTPLGGGMVAVATCGSP
jgi:hypothetical protein